MAIKPNYHKEAENVVAVQTSKDPIEQQILAAGNLSEAQVEAIRGFQRRKGLTFGEAAIALGLCGATVCFWRCRSATIIRF